MWLVWGYNIGSDTELNKALEFAEWSEKKIMTYNFKRKKW
jgi:hypothetical protein